MLKDINERALSQYKHIDMILSDKDYISDTRTIVTFFKILKSFIDIQIEIVEAFKDIEKAKFILEEKLIVHLLPIHDGVSNWIGILLDEFEEYVEKNQSLINEMREILNVVDTVDIQYKLNGIPLMDCVFDVINKDVLIESLVDRNSEIINRLEREKNNLDLLIENFETKKNMKHKVVFDGFETLEQAKAFADWYSGQGEQESVDWLEVNTEDINGAYVDCHKVAETKGYKVDENNNLIVPLKLYHKE